MTERGAIPNEGRCLPNPNFSLMLLVLDRHSLPPTILHRIVATNMAAPLMDATTVDVDSMELSFPRIEVHATDTLAEHLRDIISNLYFILVQAYDFKGDDDNKQYLSSSIKSLITNLQLLTRTSRRLPTTVPIDLIQYVEDKRNPDVYKRQIVELVMQYNQLQKGRAEAFADFRDILGREMMSAIPDMRDDVRNVLKAAGGKVDE